MDERYDIRDNYLSTKLFIAGGKISVSVPLHQAPVTCKYKGKVIVPEMDALSTSLRIKLCDEDKMIFHSPCNLRSSYE